MLKIVVACYKSSFGREDKPDVDLEENFCHDQELLTCDHNNMLETKFSEKEIKKCCV
jgi:hypothetical protein